MIIKTFCARMDHGGCGLLVDVEDGKIVHVEGDPDCSLNRGTICAKGLAQVERLNHPERLRHPLKRIGAKGEENGRESPGTRPCPPHEKFQERISRGGEKHGFRPGNAQRPGAIHDDPPGQRPQDPHGRDPRVHLPYAPGNRLADYLRVLSGPGL